MFRGWSSCTGATVLALIACGGDAAGPAVRTPELTTGSCAPTIRERDVGGEICRDYQELLDEMHFGFGDTPFAEQSVADEPILDLAGTDLPAVDDGWRPLPAEEQAAALVLRLRAGGSSLEGARERLQATDSTDIWLLADRDVRMADVASLRAAMPGARWRLVLRKSRAAIAKTFYAAYPRTPPWARELIGDCLARAPDGPAGDSARRAALRRAIRRAAGRCNLVEKVFYLMDGGAGLDVIGPAAVQMIRDCECQLTDLDGFVSTLSMLALPIPDAAWVPLPVTLPLDGTVDDWARHR